jgi:hypothetical protein
MTASDRHDYNTRQYRLMMDQIELFESGKLNLSALISRLKGLLAALDAPESSWINTFRSEWLELEQVYAFAADKLEKKQVTSVGQVIEEPSNRLIVQNAIGRMKLLIGQVIQ